MTTNTDDLRIQKKHELISPEDLISDIAVSDVAADTVANARRSIHHILTGEDDRLCRLELPEFVSLPAQPRSCDAVSVPWMTFSA